MGQLQWYNNLLHGDKQKFEKRILMKLKSFCWSDLVWSNDFQKDDCIKSLPICSVCQSVCHLSFVQSVSAGSSGSCFDLHNKICIESEIFFLRPYALFKLFCFTVACIHVSKLLASAILFSIFWFCWTLSRHIWHLNRRNSKERFLTFNFQVIMIIACFLIILLNLP